MISRINSAPASLGSTAPHFAPSISTPAGRNSFESQLSGSGSAGSHATPAGSPAASPTESRPNSPYGASLLDEYGASGGSRPGTPTGGPAAHAGSPVGSPTGTTNTHSFDHAGDMEMGNIHHGHGNGSIAPTTHGETHNGAPAAQQSTHNGSTTAPEGTEPKKSWSASFAAFGDKWDKIGKPATATLSTAGAIAGIVSLATRKQ